MFFIRCLFFLHSGNSRTTVSWETTEAGRRKVIQETVSSDGPLVSHQVKKEIQSETLPLNSSINSVPYKIDYENRYDDNSFYDGRGYSSDSDPTATWLMQQKQKLRAKRDGSLGRTREEKELVNELRSAQTRMKHRRTQSEADEASVISQYGLNDQHTFQQQNAYMKSPSPERVDLQDQYKTEKRFFVSGLERPPFTTAQTKYTFSVNDSVASKPPPSPGLGRPTTPGSPQIPVRGNSSHEAVQRSRTTQRDWNRSSSKNEEFIPGTISAADLPPGYQVRRFSLH